MSGSASSNALYGRQVSLLVGSDGGSQTETAIQQDTGTTDIVVTPKKRPGIDLSAMRFTFAISRMEISTPATLAVRVFNLGEGITKKLLSQDEFTRVVLSAGYPGNFGKIFDGTIKFRRSGRVSPVDTYLDLFVADGDGAYNFPVINKTLAKGYTDQDVNSAASDAVGQEGVTGYSGEGLGQTPAPRGRAFYNMARDILRNLASDNGMSFVIADNAVQMVKNSGYLPGDAVVLTSQTGMIGLPTQTQNGIEVLTLLDPRMKHGQRIKIDNRSIQLAQQGLSVQAEATQNSLLPRIADDGVYRVLVAEHYGDTRGQEFYSRVYCIAVDDTAPINSAVRFYS